MVEMVPVELICSARGCRGPATHQLHWNNPKLHTPAARKTWLACPEHLSRLSEFLGSRRLLREVQPVATMSALPGRGRPEPQDTLGSQE